MILAIFHLQVTRVLPTKFQVNWPFGSGEEAKNRLLRWPPWWPFWIFDWHDFSYFWSTSQTDASYQVSSQLAFWFRRRRNRFSRPSWISDWNDFSYFWSKSHPDASYQVLSQLAFGFRRTELLLQKKKRKIDFQDGHHGSHLGFPIRTILAIFDLQVTSMLPTKFQVHWPWV